MFGPTDTEMERTPGDPDKTVSFQEPPDRAGHLAPVPSSLSSSLKNALGLYSSLPGNAIAPINDRLSGATAALPRFKTWYTYPGTVLALWRSGRPSPVLMEMAVSRLP